MILPKDLIQAIDTLVKYGAKKSTLDEFVFKLVSKDLKAKPKPIVSNGHMTKYPKVKVKKESKPIITNTITNTHTTSSQYEDNYDDTYDYVPKEKNEEPNEIQQSLGAIANEDITDMSEQIMLRLCGRSNKKYKTWISCKHLSTFILSNEDNESQLTIRGELYKLMNKGFVESKKKDTKERKGVLHYALTDNGELYLNKKTGGSNAKENRV